MQVVEKSGGGLSRVYGVTVPATELSEKLEARIKEITPRMNLKGFRPGKVPAAHVKRIYGKALMGEVIEQALNKSSQQLLAEQNLRVAAQPEMEPQSDMEQVLAGGVDLSYDLNVEVMPEFDPVDMTALKLTRPVYRPSDAEVDDAVADLAKQSRTYSPKKGKAAKAEDGDQLVIDFIGRIDGEAFEGGTATDAELVIGSGQFIPGFEEQLVGASAGKDVTVKVKFPDDYGVETLKGKDAEFAVTVKEVRASEESKVDDALAQRLGLTDLDGLKAALRSNLEGEYSGASRFKIKRALLDELDSHHDFPLPPRMVEAEFVTIWKQVQDDKAAGNLPPEDEGKSEADLEGEYRKIAERRVRLGLVLAEVGRRNNIIVTDEELSTAMRQEAMRYGAQAQQIFDLLRQNQNAQAQMRAPIYEEKVVDLILGQAQVKEKAVSKEELMAEDDMPEGYGEPKKAKPKAKAAAKKEAPAKEEAKVEAKVEAKPAAKAKPAKAEAKPEAAAKSAKAEAAPAKAAKPAKAEAAPAKAEAKPAKAPVAKAAAKAEAPKAAAKAAPAKAAKPKAKG